MKNVISSVLVIAMLFSIFALTGCDSKTQPTETATETATEAATEAVTETATEAATETATEAATEAVTETVTGGVSDSAAYYKDGNLYIPINLAIKYNTYTVKSENYTWYVRYSIGIVINHPFDMKEVTVECKNNIVTIPEKYANENYFLKTRCNNVATFILVTQKPNSGYVPTLDPDTPIIIR